MIVRPQISTHLPARRATSHLLVALLAVGVTGCVTERPVERWCLDAQSYIAEHTHDANLLRDYSRMTNSPDARPALLRFSTLGVPAGVGQTRDVLGVLVGFPRVEADHWYIFLIATVRVVSGAGYPETTDAIVDIRPLGLRLDASEFRWLVGESDPTAMQHYLKARAGMPGERSAHLLFPGQSDVFALKVSGPAVVVTERRSGANWSLALPTE
jgi:hypothetical protein